MTIDYDSYKASYRGKVIKVIREAGQWITYQDDEDNGISNGFVDIPNSIKNLEQMIEAIK